MAPLEAMVKHLCVDDDPEGFRQAMVRAGFLLPDAPVSTPLVVEHMAVFYDTVRERGPRTMTSDYATTVTRRFFDFRSPLASYARIPRSYVILQRINLGLFALLGELSATADWRCIAEEIWPFFQGPPCTPMGAAEAGWRAQRAVGTHSGSLGPGPRPVPGVAGRGYRPGPAPSATGAAAPRRSPGGSWPRPSSSWVICRPRWPAGRPHRTCSRDSGG